MVILRVAVLHRFYCRLLYCHSCLRVLVIVSPFRGAMGSTSDAVRDHPALDSAQVPHGRAPFLPASGPMSSRKGINNM